MMIGQESKMTIVTLVCSVSMMSTDVATAARHFKISSEFGVEFVTIGDPGNRDSLPEESNPIFADNHIPIGAVAYEYRMARTEVTLGQYVEFVEAYYPLYLKRGGSVLGFPDFTGTDIMVGPGGVRIDPGVSSDRAAEMSWEYAARYVNWLHNGKVKEAWAFDSGVYDTATFTQNSDGTYNHQLSHAPDSRFWIPTSNEWIKAAHWDPTKNDGAGGYWLYPNSSDIESFPGLLPENGGERNAGDHRDGFPLDVMSFPEVQSPWGLFDLAGGESEWTESMSSREQIHRRLTRGTHWGEDTYMDPFFPHDIIGDGDVNNVWGLGTGLRLAAAVPSPGVIPVVLAGIFIFTTRRAR